MADLEQNINPTMNDSENTSPEIGQNNNLNTGESTGPTEKVLNFSEMSSDNSQDVNLDANKDTIFNNAEDLPNDTNKTGESLGNPEQNPVQELNSSESSNNLTSENLDFTQEPETSNNEIILGKFDNPMISTTETPQVSPSLDPSLFEHPAILETPTNEEPSAEEQQRAKLAQKEKLLQLIKTHETKAQKNGFTKGILSGVALTACIVIASCLLAKDQIVNLLNGGENQTELSASIVNLNENLDEEVENPEVDEFLDEEIENPEIDEYSDEEIENPEIDEYSDEEIENPEIDEYSDEEIENPEVDEYSDGEVENPEVDEYSDEEIENPEVDEYSDEEVENLEVDEYSDEEVENPEVDEYSDEEIENPEVDEYDNLYNITRVSSEEEANWVLPAHCSDLTCYGEDKEFTPCTTFRLSENLDENANRIGKNGVCKYKDLSELVYVELNK